MPVRTGYTFSKTRLFVYILITLFTSLIAVPFLLLWEWYRYNKK